MSPPRTVLEVASAIVDARGNRLRAGKLLGGITAERVRQLIHRLGLSGFERHVRSLAAPTSWEREQRARARDAASARRRARRRRARGLCRCGGQRDSACQLCARCRAVKARSEAARRRRRAAGGRCTRCGGPGRPGRKTCQDCTKHRMQLATRQPMSELVERGRR